MNRETVTIERKVFDGVDQFGNDEWADTFITFQALVADHPQKTSSEASRTPLDARCSLYVTGSLQINETDVFEVREITWLFDGLETWTNPFGGSNGVVIHLRRRGG